MWRLAMPTAACSGSLRTVVAMVITSGSSGEAWVDTWRSAGVVSVVGLGWSPAFPRAGPVPCRGGAVPLTVDTVPFSLMSDWEA